MPTPAELLAQSLTALRNAKRFSAPSQSYRKDNPTEYAKVIAYLDGGARPTGVTTEMGKHALLEEDARRALTPGPTPTPLPVPTWKVTMDVSPAFHSFFLMHDSPTTEYESDWVQRVVNWGAGHKYEQRRMVGLAGFRMVSGKPGRFLDWHTSPADPAGGWSPPCNPAGVAPLAIDYFGSRGIEVVAEPENSGCSGGSGNYHFQIFTPAEAEQLRGEWVWLWLDVMWGRRDTAIKGSVKVWKAGEDNPRVDVAGINTHWPQETQVTYWEGVYWSGGNSEYIELEVAATRFGRTPQEAWEDVPHLGQAWGNGNPLGQNQAISPPSGAIPIPPALRW